MTRSAAASASERESLRSRWGNCASTTGRAVVDALEDLIAAIGSPQFPQSFLAAMRALVRVELCSVFRAAGRNGVTLLFAVGDPPGLPDFPLHASRDYARSYWQFDTEVVRLARGWSDVPIVVRRRACEIADPAYRAACYDRGGVIERVSIVTPGHPALLINGYLTKPSASLSPNEIDLLELHAGILVAALRQHLRADAAIGYPLNEGALVESLLAADCGLSVREAEVVAGLILGRTQNEIAEARRLSPATIVTYRRRAYAKLGVVNQRSLTALHRRWMAEPPTH